MENRENIFGSRKTGVNERAKEQNEDREQGGYGDKYYDQNERNDGGKYDEATGERYINDGDIESPHNLTEEKPVSESETLLEELSNDPATDWLLKNGFDKFGNKIEPASSNERPTA